MKKKIGIDLDDVLLDFSGALIPWHNANYGTKYRYEDMTSYNLEDILQCPRYEIDRRMTDFHFSEEHYNALPIPGAALALERLSQDHSLIVITSKADEMRPSMEAWLAKHFPNLIESVHFTNHHLGDKSKKRKKSDVCREEGVQIFIDDACIHVTDVADICEKVFLLDRPWNQEALHPAVTRVHSWEDILKKLL